MFPIGDDNSARRSAPVVTIALIVINVLVFLLELQRGDAFIQEWAFIPGRFSEHPSADGITLLSAMFMHGGWLHLGGNMLYLWIFGNNIEDYLGKVKFIIFYVISGLAAVVTYTIFDPHSEIPLIGASGAIAGVMGAYMVLYPSARVQTLIFLGFFIQTVRVPAKILLVFWFILQIISGLPGLVGPSQGGVAWFAHVGGFAFGWLYFKLSKKRPSINYWGA